MKQRILDWIAMARAALTLQEAPFHMIAEGTGAFQRAVWLVVVVGLVVGGVNAMVQLPSVARTPTFDVDAYLRQIDQSFSYGNIMRGEQPPEVKEFLRIYRGSMESFASQIPKIMATPSPLPGYVGRFLTWLGDWLSTPFALLARWLGISIWIMLFARWLGGRGTLLSYLGASSLSVLPHLLRAFGFIPLLGGLLAVLAGIWGLIIQVKAVEITHHLPQNRAIAAVLLPYLLILFFLAILAFIAFVGMIIFIASASG